MACAENIIGHEPWQHHSHNPYPTSPSNASTTSSSSSSAFSVDAPSSQSSVSSSAGWSASTWQNENEDSRIFTRMPLQRQCSDSRSVSSEEDLTPSCRASYDKPHTSPIGPRARENPRRTNRLESYEAQEGKQIKQCPRPPPSLVRQSERKDNFVDSLVDTTTQMIETIWPLSVLGCGRDAILGVKQQNLLGLRTFVQEVLKRSKTSYSTLQVALYYLILIQSCIPKHDFTMEQPEDSPACRAMQCGRRMFLAALILASKYLQDRNFSARAWSRISGLRTCEINANEMAFLSAVNWKLHIPESVFHKWTDIVLKYSPSAQVNRPPRSLPTPTLTWKALVPLLTPELDTVFGSGELDPDSGYDSNGSDTSSDVDFDGSPPPTPAHKRTVAVSTPNQPIATTSYTIPLTLEPTPRDMNCASQILPPLPRLGLLPTPQLTPQTCTFGTPAVSASGFCFKKPSMSYAMAQMKEKDLARSTLDNPHEWKPRLPHPFPNPARRSSLASSASSMSSPESMISDRSSRSSRSSSISSIASSNRALSRPRLAVQATRRCAEMQLCGLKEESGRSTPMQHDGKEGLDLSWVDWCAQQDPSYKQPTLRMCEELKQKLYGNRSEKYSPSRESHQISQAHFPKRLSVDPETCRGFRPSVPQTCGEPLCGNTLIDTASTQETAVALRDLVLDSQLATPTVSSQSPLPHISKTLKRPRPASMDLSLQSTVQHLLAQSNEDDCNVLLDENTADSFVLRPMGKENQRPHVKLVLNNQPKPSLSREGLPRKRTCAGSDRGEKSEGRLYERSASTEWKAASRNESL